MNAIDDVLLRLKRLPERWRSYHSEGTRVTDCLEHLIHVTYDRRPDQPVDWLETVIETCSCRVYPLWTPPHLLEGARNQIEGQDTHCRRLEEWEIPTEDHLAHSRMGLTLFSLCISGRAHVRYYRQGNEHVFRGRLYPLAGWGPAGDVDGLPSLQQVLTDRETAISDIAVLPCRCPTDFPHVIDLGLMEEFRRRRAQKAPLGSVP